MGTRVVIHLRGFRNALLCVTRHVHVSVNVRKRLKKRSMKRQTWRGALLRASH